MRLSGNLGPNLSGLGALGVTSYNPPQSAVPAGSGGYINAAGSIAIPWSFAMNYAPIRTDLINALAHLPLSNVTSQNNVVFGSGQWSWEVMGCPQNAYTILTYVPPAPVTVVAPPTTPTAPPTTPTSPGGAAVIDTTPVVDASGNVTYVPNVPAPQPLPVMSTPPMPGPLPGQPIQVGPYGGNPTDGDTNLGPLNLVPFETGQIFPARRRPGLFDDISPGVLIVGGIIAFLLLTGKRSNAS